MEAYGSFGLWAFVIVGGPILLGLIIAYGALQSRRRSRQVKQVTETTTESNYRAEQRREDLLERQDRI
jgi:hypothetical protein